MEISNPSESDLAALLQELDQDGDGEVSKQEFEMLLFKSLEKMHQSECELYKAMKEEVPIVADFLPLTELDEEALFNDL